MSQLALERRLDCFFEQSSAVLNAASRWCPAAREDLNRETARHHQALRRLVADGATTSNVTSRIADLNERISDAEQRRPELDARMAELERETMSRAEAEAAFADFDSLWNNLIPREQARLLNLLISNVEYDAIAGTVAVTFRPTSINALVRTQTKEEVA